MNAFSAAEIASATAQGKGIITTATTPDLDWGGGPGSPANLEFAAERFQGIMSGGGSEAPAPLPGESIEHYDDRVLGGNWTPGTGAMGWVNGMADTIGEDLFNVVAGALEDASKEVDPSGTIAGAISSVNAQVQAGLSADQRAATAAASDAKDAASAPSPSVLAGAVAKAAPAKPATFTLKAPAPLKAAPLTVGARPTTPTPVGALVALGGGVIATAVALYFLAR